MVQEVERERKGRMLTSTILGKYTLLNSEKLTRALDLLEGIVEPKGEEADILAKCKSMKHEDAVLALYDRFGGGVRMGERKLAIGTFYDFALREPREGVDLSEDDFADEFVLVKKKSKKGVKNENVKSRVKRLEEISKKEPKLGSKKGVKNEK